MEFRILLFSSFKNCTKGKISRSVATTINTRFTELTLGKDKRQGYKTIKHNY